MAEERVEGRDSKQAELTNLFASRLIRSLTTARRAAMTGAEKRLANFGAYSSYHDLVKLGRKDYADELRARLRKAVVIPARQLRG